jgi:hypothetical protein
MHLGTVGDDPKEKWSQSDKDTASHLERYRPLDRLTRVASVGCSLHGDMEPYGGRYCPYAPPRAYAAGA